MEVLKALLLKGAPSRPGNTSGDPAKSIPPVRSRTVGVHSKGGLPSHQRKRGNFRLALEGHILAGRRERLDTLHPEARLV